MSVDGSSDSTSALVFSAVPMAAQIANGSSTQKPKPNTGFDPGAAVIDAGKNVGKFIGDVANGGIQIAGGLLDQIGKAIKDAHDKGEISQPNDGIGVIITIPVGN